ncbi:MAG: hypothetical protein HOL29_09225 [Euryarchaeota archaeon]|jgi:hypothetical protein|nr:hypothetical protein [Euryarchaeota archaeon]
MAAIISEKFRIFNAKQFLESLSEGATGTEATSDERTKSYFFVGRPQRWSAYLEIYSTVGTFSLGETVYVTTNGMTVNNSSFRATVEAVYPNSILLSGVFPNIAAVPGIGSQIRGDSSNATAYAAVYRYATDEIPLRPADNDEEEKSIHDDMIALKRVGADQVRAVVRRFNWNPTVNPKFDMWRPDYSYARAAQVDPDGVGSLTPAESLANAQYYLVNNNYEVFKCLYNGTNVDNPSGTNVSLEPKRNPGPTGEGVYDSATGVYTEYPDVTNGYVWKYLYTIPTNDVLRFLSTDFMPIVEDSTVTTLAASQAGAISTIIVRDNGNNLPSSKTIYTPILGDGANGIVRFQTGPNGNITTAYLVDNAGARVNISGSGYTYANVLIKNGFLYEQPDLTSPLNVSSNASGDVEVIVPPQGGHGADCIAELLAKRIMANIRLTYAEGDGDFPVDNDFRRIGIIKNPKLPAPSTDFATQDTISAIYAVKLNNVSGSFQPDEVAKQEVAAGEFAYGTVVSWVWDEVAAGQTPTSGTLKYFQSPDLHKDNGIVRAFVSDAARLVEGQTSLISGAVETGYSTGGATLPLLGLTFTNGLAVPEIAKNTGEIVYIENRRLITRAPDQIEDIKLVIEF